MMTFVLVFSGVLFFALLILGSFFGLIGSFIKMIEFLSDGRFKFFDREYGEPIFSDKPRPVEY